ncbi:hypothetical protein TOPH_02734 [Tolypocladium ophioglossoides CBS 100239]|uniref:F-box domain-containing protein n=1 Tax=Tolypocladium ophioglossoides (strain CBS 100239) TaxID=1163406 RepID=A0A0L0NFH3_TOLOC|nr:hypothetical protein TOPH_02734 [Tolypocladium ophioglossoides CBS 100239]
MPAKRRLSPGEGADDDDDDDDDDDNNNNKDRLPAKRLRVSEPGPPAEPRPWSPPPPSHDVISALSDELLVRILAYMDERALLAVSPVSKRFHRITADSQLWRPHYYRRFILPRAHRIPGFRAGAARISSRLHYSGQKSIWADGGWGRRGGLVDPGDATAGISDSVDWKKQYKLRHNWARGRCAVDEVPVHEAERSPPPEWQTLVKVVDGLAVTADGESGLRAWDLKTRKIIAQASLKMDESAFIPPTCLAVDDQRLASGILDVSSGFEDGTFGVWSLDVKQGKLTLLYRQAKSYFGELVAIAYGHPYVLTASRLGFISLYMFERSDGGPQHHETASTEAPRPTDGVSAVQGRHTSDARLPQPRQVTSLKSHSTRAPLALSIRRMATSVVASIAYTFDAVGGWAIGIQDLDIKPSGLSTPDVVSSRVAFTLPTQTRKSTTPSPESTPTRAGARSPRYVFESDEDGPIRLCYSHPYLLATLPDNTLVLHLCTSTATSLSISPGIRLWGHTSGISDAEITPRGKAVSVSTRGDEIRVWELEGRVGGSSVEVRPRQQGDDVDEDGPQERSPASSKQVASEDRKNWVGFDDEMVVVLKEARDGRESLMVYDFT